MEISIFTPSIVKLEKKYVWASIQGFLKIFSNPAQNQVYDVG